MNAQEQVLEYIAKVNSYDMPDDVFGGKMFSESIGIQRPGTPGNVTISVKGEVIDGQIVVTEITKTKRNEIADGRLVEHTDIENTEVLRASL